MSIIIPNKGLLASLFISFIQECYGDSNQSINRYASPGQDVVLPCQVAINSAIPRWLKGSFILTTGSEINQPSPSLNRLTIDFNVNEKKYNLLIANVTESDYGNYECLIQNKQDVLKKKITLIRHCKHDINDQKTTDHHREAKRTVVIDKSDNIIEQTSTVTKDTNEREGKGNEATNTSGFLRDYLYHMLLAVGLVVVLSLSVGSSFCINHNCKGKMSPQKNENELRNNVIHEQIPESEIDDEVTYEMCSSEYESIDEMQIIASKFSDPIHHNLAASTHSIENQTFTLPVGPYLDVIDDTCYQQQEKHDHSGISSYNSTLSNRSEIQLQNYETIFPTDRNLEAGILQTAICTSNDLNDLVESFSILFDSRHSSFSSNSAHSSAANDPTNTQQDDYLNPYMPLNTNDMDYLESYSAPNNQNRSETILSKDYQDKSF